MQLSLANPLTLYVQSMKDASFVALFPQAQRNGNKPAKGTQEHDFTNQMKHGTLACCQKHRTLKLNQGPK